jgi:glycerol-3-phosphate dehydrogenase
MVAAIARTAAAHGAQLATRTRVTRLLRDGARVSGAEVRDEETGETAEIRAAHVVLAVGAWTDEVRASAAAGAGDAFDTQIKPSKGVHLVVARERIAMETGILARTEKSVLFVLPSDFGWIIGDTDTAWTHGPDRVVASGAEVDYLLAKANALLADPLTRSDIVGVQAGLRPLVGPAATTDTTRLSRRHVVQTPVPGLTTVAGGKYTIYRVMAADVIDAAARDLGGEVPGSPTAGIPIAGADGFVAAWHRRAELARRAGVETVAMERMLRRYGDRVEELLALIAQRPELAQPLHGGDGHIAAEVVHACAYEGALRLEDVLERRTRLAISVADRGVTASEPVAALMAGELGWTAERAAGEVDAWRRRVAAERAGEEQADDGSAVRAYEAALAGPGGPGGPVSQARVRG